MSSELRSRTSVALIWDLIGNYSGQIVAFVISIILARLLSPEDFGIVGMSLVFINMLKIFMNLGLGSAIVQRKEVTDLMLSSVFYVNLGIGILITLLSVLAAPWIAAFYEEDKVRLIVQLLSVTILLNSFNVVQTAVLYKSLDLKKLTTRNLVSQVTAGIVACIMALNGMGLFALVIQHIVASAMNSILLWRLTCWYPKLEFSWGEIQKLMSFSAYEFSAQAVGQVLKHADTMVIGKSFSPTMLGFFARANTFANLVARNSSMSIRKVLFPALSMIQDDKERFKSVFYSVFNVTLVISTFLTGAFYISGEFLILNLFGEKWAPSVPIFYWLLIKGLTTPLSSIVISSFLAAGMAKQNFHFGNIRKALIVISLVVAFYFEFEVFLKVLVGVHILAALLNALFASISLKLNFVRLISIIVIPSGISFSLVYFLNVYLTVELHWLGILVQLLLYALVFGLYVFFFNKPMVHEAKQITYKIYSFATIRKSQSS